MYSRRGRSQLYGYNSYNTPDVYLMPYTEIEQFPNDSSNLDCDLTIMKLEITNDTANIICFNKKGIKKKLKKKIEIQQQVTVGETSQNEH